MSIQRIKLDSKLKGLVLSGAKTRTMRSGRRDYIEGPAVFDVVEDGETLESLPIIIESVDVKLFAAITDEDAVFEGYKKASELQEALHRYYPTLTDSDLVTVIGFRQASTEPSSALATLSAKIMAVPHKFVYPASLYSLDALVASGDLEVMEVPSCGNDLMEDDAKPGTGNTFESLLDDNTPYITPVSAYRRCDRTTKESKLQASKLADLSKACRCDCCKRASKEANKAILERIASEEYHSDRMIEWIKKGAKNAVTSFTSGPQRNIAYAIEELLRQTDLIS